MPTVEEDRTTGEPQLRSRRTTLAILVACVAVLLAVPAVWLLTRDDPSVGERPSVGSGAGADASAPAEGGAAARPSDTPSPSGAVEAPAPQSPAVVAEPVTLRLTALGVEAPVVPSGVAPDGWAEIPEDVGTIGWYRFGPAPGSELGSAVLIGHVDSREQGRGALFSLRESDVGDVIEVARADGSTVSYRVVAREQVDKQQLPVDELFARDGEPRLTIITCGGEFNRSLSSYSDNVVVTAVPA